MKILIDTDTDIAFFEEKIRRARARITKEYALHKAAIAPILVKRRALNQLVVAFKNLAKIENAYDGSFIIDNVIFPGDLAERELKKVRKAIAKGIKYHKAELKPMIENRRKCVKMLQLLKRCHKMFLRAQKDQQLLQAEMNIAPMAS